MNKNQADERFFEETRRAFMIPGMLWPREMFALRDLFSQSVRHAEIGVFCGKSLYVTAAAMAIYGPSAEGKLIFAVDSFRDVFLPGLEMLPSTRWWMACLTATITEIQERFAVSVRLLNTDSVGAARILQQEGGGDLDSVYVDANHSEEHVSGDIRCWWSQIRENGLLAGHDYTAEFTGTMNAVNNAFANQFSVVSDTRIWWARKNRLTDEVHRQFVARS